MIPCAFDGHAQRASICRGEATSFFRTAKGMLWPLCQACSDQHKKLVLDLAKDGPVKVEHLIGATFDIPLDDPETLLAWRAQDPEKVQSVIRSVDERAAQSAK